MRARTLRVLRSLRVLRHGRELLLSPLFFGLFLLLCGAGTRAVGPDTPVADAAQARDAAAVRSRLKAGADVNAAQGDGMTALHWAALNADAEMTATLLAAGANVRATTRLGGQTAIHLASQAGAANVVAALIAAGAD